MALKAIDHTPGADGSDEERRAIDLRREERAFLRRLVELRKEAELSQTEVADRMGIDRSFVSRFEKFDSAPRLDTVVRYAHAIGAKLRLGAELDQEEVPSHLPSQSEWVLAAVRSHVEGSQARASRRVWVETSC